MVSLKNLRIWGIDWLQRFLRCGDLLSSLSLLAFAFGHQLAWDWILFTLLVDGGEPLIFIGNRFLICLDNRTSRAAIIWFVTLVLDHTASSLNIPMRIKDRKPFIQDSFGGPIDLRSGEEGTVERPGLDCILNYLGLLLSWESLGGLIWNSIPVEEFLIFSTIWKWSLLYRRLVGQGIELAEREERFPTA